MEWNKIIKNNNNNNLTDEISLQMLVPVKSKQKQIVLEDTIHTYLYFHVSTWKAIQQELVFTLCLLTHLKALADSKSCKKGGFDGRRLGKTSDGIPYFRECKYNFSELQSPGKVRLWEVENSPLKYLLVSLRWYKTHIIDVFIKTEWEDLELLTLNWSLFT